MRSLAIQTDLIKRNYGGFINPFWIRFERDLKKMLADKAKPVLEKDSITEEVLFIGDELLKGKGLPEKVIDVRQTVDDWSWYVSDRICPTGRVVKVLKSPEDELIEELRDDPEDGSKKVILVYGHTGHGKTTFLRHFFYNWLPKHGGQKFSRHIIIRVSMGLGGFGKDIENDFDKKVNRMLMAAFPWLFTPDYLLEVVKYHHRNNQANIDYLENNFPRNDMLYSMVTWINKYNNSCVIYTEDEKNHDFNRLLIEYLTVKYNIHLIFIMDNVDQSPASLQSNFYILARHKLDWLTSIDKVVFILGVRGYLLNKVFKESVVQAYPDPSRIRIFPPPIHSYLATRIRSFDKSLKKKRYQVTMLDSKVIEIPKQDLIKMLNKFNENYSDPHNDIIMSRLSNYDVRRQSDFIKACFRSQAINWSDYIHFLSHGKEEVHFSQHDILRAILRDSNSIVEVSPDQLLLNIFSCGTGSNFSNSLNRWYILKFLSESDRITDYLVDHLELLGHPKCVTIKSIEDLLQANVIASPDGVRLKEDAVQHLTMSDEHSTIGREYLYSLPFNLLYVESMAYITPLDEDLVSEVPIPYDSEGPTFEEFIRASAVLVRQIKRDERMQLEYIQHDTKLMQLVESNGLLGFGDKVCSQIINTLRHFEKHNIVNYENWAHLYCQFDKT